MEKYIEVFYISRFLHFGRNLVYVQMSILLFVSLSQDDNENCVLFSEQYAIHTVSDRKTNEVILTYIEVCL